MLHANDKPAFSLRKRGEPDARLALAELAMAEGDAQSFAAIWREFGLRADCWPAGGERAPAALLGLLGGAPASAAKPTAGQERGWAAIFRFLASQGLDLREEALRAEIDDEATRAALALASDDKGAALARAWAREMVAQARARGESAAEWWATASIAAIVVGTARPQHIDSSLRWIERAQAQLAGAQSESEQTGDFPAAKREVSHLFSSRSAAEWPKAVFFNALRAELEAWELDGAAQGAGGSAGDGGADKATREKRGAKRV